MKLRHITSDILQVFLLFAVLYAFLHITEPPPTLQPADTGRYAPISHD